ncbi:MAG: XrtB/PEP-CTERM-associated transcriptional regulator EpsA [Methylophilaceae bacterium]
MTIPLDGLTSEESGIFIEVFEASLRINQREQLFSWLQGCFQYLFPHEVLICGIHLKNENHLHFESFISTRYVTEQHVSLATGHEGLISRVIAAWKRNHRPILIADGLSPGEFGSYTVPFVERPGALQEIELKNIAAHGLATKEGDVLTFFCFSRVPGQLSARHVYLLELLVPHLHAVLIRIVGAQYERSYQGRSQKVIVAKRTITRREQEVMQWINSGKTNLEIAAILNISPLTVKNHVHSILRKLGVENRSNACAKASQLGLLKI